MPGPPSPAEQSRAVSVGRSAGWGGEARRGCGAAGGG